MTCMKIIDFIFFHNLDIKNMMKLMIGIFSFIVVILSFSMGATDAEKVYSLFVYFSVLINFFKFEINKVDIIPYFIGIIIGFILNNLYLDYKGFEWVSKQENWMNTSVKGWFLTLVIILTITIIFKKDKNEQKTTE